MYLVVRINVSVVVQHWEQKLRTGNACLLQIKTFSVETEFKVFKGVGHSSPI